MDGLYSAHARITISVASRNWSLTALNRACSLLLAHICFDLPDPGKIVMQQGIHRGRRLPLQSVTPVRCQRVSQRPADQKNGIGVNAIAASDGL